MTDLIQDAVNALSLGSLYALITLGMALIFGILRLVNFAHGELIMIGGYFIVLAAFLPWPLLLVGSVVVVAVAALGMERLAFRPLRGAPDETLLVGSFALAIFLQNLALSVFGALPKTASVAEVLATSWNLGGVHIPLRDLVALGAALLLLGGLAVFLSRTRLGLQMRATAEDFQMTRLLGVSANRVIAAAFAISGAAAAIAAFLLVVQTGAVTPIMGLQPILVGFVAMVLGGMGSLRGAIIGAYVLGIAAVALQTTLPIELRPYRDALLFALVVGILVLRPQGIIVARTMTSRV